MRLQLNATRSKANLPYHDDTYARLIAAHDGLTEAESHAVNARLLLILMNHLGPGVIAAALETARRTGQRPAN